ncbi:MAG TPA: carboxymuconolactone decarboxylase family protein [Nocardioides sp.]|uniref:carboxymuconolactone decarboxylase family protein n=1 Tax=Nocardioides sp. TaxID=35761 RepID=UPI002EDB640D
MPHIALTTNLPGITGLLAQRPDTGGPLSALADQLLVAPSTLSRPERELIATYVSRLNDCDFCATSHGAFAAIQLDGGWEAGWDVVDAVCGDPATAPVSAKLRALLAIAGRVQQGGKHVDDEVVAAARAHGATDDEIHDTVLIAAAFCMFNRYVDGLATFAPPSREDYRPSAERIAAQGYADRSGV